MATPTRDVNVIVDNIISYLAFEGYDIRDEFRAELAARVEGHADLKALENYNAKSKQGLVYELGLDDVCSSGGLVKGLKDTLSRPVLGIFDSISKAEEQAHEFAVRLARPIIVLSGNHSVMAVCENPTEAYPGYAVYRAVELKNPGAPFADTEFSVELDLVDAGYTSLRDAVGIAAEAVFDEARWETPAPIVVVEEEGNSPKRIMWRSQSLRV
jgi:hypothetical protein